MQQLKNRVKRLEKESGGALPEIEIVRVIVTPGGDPPPFVIKPGPDGKYDLKQLEVRDG